MSDKKIKTPPLSISFTEEDIWIRDKLEEKAASDKRSVNQTAKIIFEDALKN